MALTPEQEAHKNELLAEIGRLNGEISRLEYYKGRLGEEYDNVRDNVYDPERKYDLTVSTDISHWVGKLEETGAQYQADTAGATDGFMGGISSVMGIIDGVIGKIREKISSLWNEVAAIGS